MSRKEVLIALAVISAVSLYVAVSILFAPREDETVPAPRSSITMCVRNEGSRVFYYIPAFQPPNSSSMQIEEVEGIDIDKNVVIQAEPGETSCERLENVPLKQYKMFVGHPNENNPIYLSVVVYFELTEDHSHKKVTFVWSGDIRESIFEVDGL